MGLDPSSEIIGAIKIKDGLFIGDEFASQDLEFVIANKVTHVVNCASREVPNHWEAIGVTYLNLQWQDRDNQIIFVQNEEERIFEFIESAVAKAESVLVHSLRGQTRASCAITCYIMRKYRWSLLKTLEYLNSRRPELEIRATYIQQLSSLEARLKFSTPAITSKWT